eukprot:TRINITY_DN7826_c0_g1_i1.p1 TRINITY_DN7826_c0_g1~~TRINITY_DN7826_c0_g1_i1.p1  ORF type:complete len:737 (+),score=91.14 TRINITY_DN7826_c0_g1_i1:17-2227(+)
MKGVVWFMLFFIACPSHCLSDFTQSNLEKFFDEHYSRNVPIPSLSVIVSLGNGTTLFSKSYGYQNYKDKIKTTSSTIFNLGALSTILTTATIMSAVDKDNLDINKNVNLYYESGGLTTRMASVIVGNYTSYEGYPVVVGSDLSIKQLLRHSHGLDGSGTRGRFTIPENRRELDPYMSLFAPQRVRSEGIISSFSHHGVSYAALAVQAATGTPFYKLVNDRIINELNLTGTFPMGTREVLENKNLQSYSLSGGENYEVQSYHILRQYYPAFDMYSSAEDFSKLVQIFLNNGVVDGNQILSQSSVNNMLSTHFSQFHGNHYLARNASVAFGLVRGQLNSVNYYESLGHSSSWQNLLRIFPTQKGVDQNVSLLVLSHASDEVEVYNQDVADKFILEFFNSFSCSGNYSLCEKGCYVSQENFPIKFDPPADPGRYIPYVGTYLNLFYSRTSWEKFRAYTDKLKTFYQSVDHHNIVDVTISEDGNNLMANSNCALEIDDGLFYIGALMNITTSGNTNVSSCPTAPYSSRSENNRVPPNFKCYYPLPLSTRYIMQWKVDNPSGVAHYMVTGLHSSLYPYERQTWVMALDWEMTIYCIAGFYSIMCAFTILISVISCKCSSAFEMKNTRSVSLLVFLSTFSILGNAICNVSSIFGLYIMGSTLYVINENYAAPIACACLSLLGFVFWMLLIYCDILLWMKSGLKIKSKAFMVLKLKDVIPILAEVLYVMIMVQWNWFGPSRVV